MPSLSISPDFTLAERGLLILSNLSPELTSLEVLDVRREVERAMLTGKPDKSTNWRANSTLDKQTLQPTGQVYDRQANSTSKQDKFTRNGQGQRRNGQTLRRNGQTLRATGKVNGATGKLYAQRAKLTAGSN